VAVVDFPAVGDAAQLRVAIGAVDAVRHLSWSAVIPALEDEGASDEPYGTEREALRAELRGLGIVTREEWGARATRCSSTDGKTKMAIHYTVTPSDNPAAQVRAIQRYHMDTKGWCDIGYHFLVGADGSLYEGRPLQLVGAHVGGHNTGNIGVSFIGCFHPSGCSGMGPTTPQAAMIDAGGRLLGALSRLYGIPLSREAVKGHREYPGTSTNCPGDYLYARIDDLLAIEFRHHETTPRRLPQEAARLELLQRLPHRRTADAEQSRHVILAHALARLQGLVTDRVEQHPIGIFGARATFKIVGCGLPRD
jgi:hypothetical protein